MEKRTFWLCSTIIWMVFLFYLSVYPTPPSLTLIKVSFSLRHLICYFSLSSLIFLSIKNFKLAIFLTGTYGLLLEILQFTLPYRSFDVLDIAINYFGASFILLAKIFKI